MESVRLLPSTGCQSTPLLPASEYWLVLEPTHGLPFGPGRLSSSAVRRVGEYCPLIGPAPATIVTPWAGRLLFHTNRRVWVVMAPVLASGPLSVTTPWTK